MTKDIFLQELRLATGPYHLKLEQNKYSMAIVGTQVTIQDYGAYLKKMYGVVYAFEQVVYPLLATVFGDIDGRLKSPLILEDLKSLHQPAENIPTVPASSLHTLIINMPSALGAMYVIEGSTLGNNFLQKHLHKTLGAAVDGKLGYFTAYGNDNGTKWKSFTEKMWVYTNENSCEEQVIESAVNGFKLIGDWMNDSQ